MNARLNGVTVNEIQGNPFQVDVNYRGFTVSPLLGTPQGLSVYQDGVRVNEPFGESVNWDLIPRQAIASIGPARLPDICFGMIEQSATRRARIPCTLSSASTMASSGEYPAMRAGPP